jgi:hypothetical protein
MTKLNFRVDFQLRKTEMIRTRSCIAPCLTFGREATPRQLTFEELVAIGSTFPVVIFMGHGADGQIKDLDSAATKLHTCIDRLDAEYGVDNYLFIFGGDPCDEAAPSIGVLVAQIADRVLLFAIQHQIVDEWGGFANQGWGGHRSDGMAQLAGYTLFETSYHQNQTDICWSGLKCNKKGGAPLEPRQCGGMVEFALDMVAEGVQIGHILMFGGGPATAMDADIFNEQGFPVFYERIEKRQNLESGGRWGQLDDKAFLKSAEDLCT